MEDDAPDEEDDGQRRRKRPKRVPSKESLDHFGVFQVHPLKIVLHVYDDEVSDPKSTKLITLKFEYLFKLNVVCVGVEGSHEGPENNILCNLFPDDTGVELPHQVWINKVMIINLLPLSPVVSSLHSSLFVGLVIYLFIVWRMVQSAKLFVGDVPAFDETRTSRPYKWAQHLAGIDFLPEIAPLLSGHETASNETTKSEAIVSGLSLYRQQNRVQTVVQRIRVRRRAQLALV